MHRKLLRGLLLATLLVPALGRAATEEDFEVKTTRHLLNLCTVPAHDPRYKEAIHSRPCQVVAEIPNGNAPAAQVPYGLPGEGFGTLCCSMTRRQRWGTPRQAAIYVCSKGT